MKPRPPAPPQSDLLKRRVLMSILALSWVSSNIAWALMESRGLSSPALRWVFGLNFVFHPAMFVIVRARLWPLRWVDLACLLFAAGLCGACMALRFYSPHGAQIDLQPLYLWIPIIYVFAFTLPNHRLSLVISLVIMLSFVAISVPFIVRSLDHPDGNFTIQMHMVSAVMIVALYFFSSHLTRFQAAQLTLDQLARLANTDELTRLANRRRMTEAIESELHRHARYGQAFSLVLIDVDHFKNFNDRLGHGMGDEVLVALAERAMAVMRDVDMLGRWGGEEFVVVLPQTAYDDAMRKAALLCSQVSGKPLVDRHPVTISCGVTTVTTGDTVDTLLHRADQALYAAKKRGRNRAEGLQDKMAMAVPGRA